MPARKKSISFKRKFIPISPIITTHTNLSLGREKEDINSMNLGLV
jgi:hypothetical protein